MPKALRACWPFSPKTSTKSSEAPLATRCCSLKVGALFTNTSHPTASEHMKILLQAGLVRANRIKQWTFYKRDENKIRKAKQTITDRI